MHIQSTYPPTYLSICTYYGLNRVQMGDGHLPSGLWKLTPAAGPSQPLPRSTCALGLAGKKQYADAAFACPLSRTVASGHQCKRPSRSGTVAWWPPPHSLARHPSGPSVNDPRCCCENGSLPAPHRHQELLGSLPLDKTH